MSESEPLKVGSTVWVFQPNHYRSGKTYREKWIAKVIESETARSWVIDVAFCGGTKLPKKRKKEWPEYLVSEAEIDDRQYVQEHRHLVAEFVHRIKDASTLRQIAALVGYNPTP